MESRTKSLIRLYVKSRIKTGAKFVSTKKLKELLELKETEEEIGKEIRQEWKLYF